MFWIVQLELNCWNASHASFMLLDIVMSKRSMQREPEIYLFLQEQTQFSFGTCNTHVAFNSRCLHTWNTASSFPWHSEVEVFKYTACRRLCFCVSHLILFFPLSKKKKRGDIWVTAGCEVEHQTLPECLESARGRDVMMCQPTSHHVWLPARRRSPAKSVYIIDRMKNSNLSQMQSAHLDTMGAVYAWCFHQWSRHFKF